MHRLGLRWSATQTSVGAGLEGNRYFTKPQAWWATKISPKAVRIDFEVEDHFSEPGRPWPVFLGVAASILCHYLSTFRRIHDVLGLDMISERCPN
jgi:hypothetical protein